MWREKENAEVEEVVEVSLKVEEYEFVAISVLSARAVSRRHL